MYLQVLSTREANYHFEEEMASAFEEQKSVDIHFCQWLVSIFCILPSQVDVYKTWTGFHGPGPWTTMNQPMKNTIAYVLEGFSRISGLLWDRAPTNGKTTNLF